MNRCKNCGAEFDSPFCPYCGTKAEETTPYQESKKTMKRRRPRHRQASMRQKIPLPLRLLPQNLLRATQRPSLPAIP